MAPEAVLTLGMFGGLIVAIMFGVSLSYAMGAVAVITAYLMWGFGGFMSVVAPVFNYMWMLMLSAVPLFILIGVVLANSKIAEEMYSAFYLWSGNLRGGLAIGSTIFAAALSAMTGNCSASTVTTGLVGIPQMRKRNYDERMIFGTIGSAGTLGILIPPSISLIIIGMMTTQSVGKLFAGGLAGGLIILISFILYILIRSWLNPQLCPSVKEHVDIFVKIKALKSVCLPLILISSVLISIFFGIATPTEAASIGAVCVVILVMIRKEFNWEFVKSVTFQTAVISGMVMWIMFGAGAFVTVFRSSGGIHFIQNLLLGLDMSPLLMVIWIQVFVLFLGMFLDPMGIILICLPLVDPIIRQAGIDPLWFAIIFNINICIGYITPPFGYNLFYLKTLDPKINIFMLYQSMIPFIAIMLFCEALMFIFPELITYLPKVMVR